MLERLDFKTARYDKLADAILIDGKKSVVEISHEALEALFRCKLTGEEAVLRAEHEAKRLNRLVNIIPPDDGKIHITTDLMLGEGQFSELHKNSSGE